MSGPALLRLLGAGLLGAAGLGGESLLLTGVSLVVGGARASAFGLAVWIAFWALGAWVSGRCRGMRAFALFGAGVVLFPAIAMWASLALANSSLSEAASVFAGALLIGMVAFPQGAFLPWLARAGGERDVSLLFAANLIGAVVGVRWLASDIAGALGLLPAAQVVSGVAAMGVACAWLGQSRADKDPEPSVKVDRISALLVGLTTLWLAGVEWVGFRLGALWLGGMQPAVTALLSASLLSLAFGAALLPRLFRRDSSALACVLTLAAAGGLVLAHGGLPGYVLSLTDSRAAESPLLVALALVAPALVPLGAVVPLVHRRGEGESGARLGGLLLHEAWGALIGVPLVHLVLVPTLGCGGTVSLLSLLAVPLIYLTAPRSFAMKLGIVAVSVAAASFTLREPALRTPALQKPEFRIVSFEEDAHFAVTVVEDGLRGEKTLLTDDFRATAVGDDYLYMRVLGHLPLLLHPDPARVAVLAFGTGTTAGAVARHEEVESIEVLELSDSVLDVAPEFFAVNGGVLEDERTTVHLGDGRRTLAGFDGELDVLTMEPLLPDSPFAVHLYTPGFYDRAKRALAPGGLLCQWVPPQALHPETFDAVVGAFTDSFPWSGVFLFGTQVILIGGEKAPALDPARFATEGELFTALEVLGLDSPIGAASRWVTSGGSWPAVERPVTDGDPWVLFRPRRIGVELLGDLPNNLGRLRRLEEELPFNWRLGLGAEGRARLEEARVLRRAREAWHRDEYELRRMAAGDASLAPLSGAPELGVLDAYLSAIAKSPDPEVQLLRREIAFVRAYRRGVEGLLLGDATQAFEALGEAADLRPQAADVHLHASLAAFRGGRPGVAKRLADEAYRLCPGLLETSQGRRVVALGLPAHLQGK